MSDGTSCGSDVDDLALGPSSATCWQCDCGLRSSLDLNPHVQMWVVEIPSLQSYPKTHRMPGKLPHWAKVFYYIKLHL